MALNEVGLIQAAQGLRRAIVACTTLVLYEYFLQLANEVEFFWKKRWTVVKVLFLSIRYFSIVIMITDTVVFTLRKPSHNLCRDFFYWLNLGHGVQVLSTHALLAARLYAMYNCSRGIFSFLAGLIIGECLILIVVSFLPAINVMPPHRIATNEPLPGVFICTVLKQSNGPHWRAYFYATVLLVEGIFLGMALWQAWLHRPSQGGVELMHRLTRDSASCFLVIFWMYIVNLVLWATNNPLVTVLESGIPFSFALPCIVVARLMIYMRAAHYEVNPGLAVDSRYIDDHYLPATSIQFGHTVATADNEEQGEQH